MNAVAEAASALLEALRTVPGVHVYADPGASVETPALVLGAPALEWRTGCLDPTQARFAVAVMVAADEHANTALWELLPQIAAAVDTYTEGVVVRADPLPRNVGSAEMPSYDLEVEVPL